MTDALLILRINSFGIRVRFQSAHRASGPHDLEQVSAVVFVRHGVLAIGSTEVVGWDRLVQGLLPAHHLLTSRTLRKAAGKPSLSWSRPVLDPPQRSCRPDVSCLNQLI